MEKESRRRRGFSLIELLAVIAIILLLVGLLFPAILSIQKKARQMRAQGDVSVLVHGLKQYFNEYQRWPTNVAGAGSEATVGGIAADSNLVAMLGGQNVSNDNPRLKLFMQIPPQAADAAGRFVDPWRNPYRYMCDFDYDETLKITYAVGSTNITTAAVGAWSSGPDGKSDTAAQRADDLTTWQ